MCWIAKHLPGTQSLRQLMGHRQFGARVVHGDCLFLTMSPDPVKSAMVLRLGRYRKTDPYVVHGDEVTKRLARQNYPPMEAKHDSPVLSRPGERKDDKKKVEDFLEIDIPN